MLIQLGDYICTAVKTKQNIKQIKNSWEHSIKEITVKEVNSSVGHKEDYMIIKVLSSNI